MAYVLPSSTALHRATPVRHGDATMWQASSDAVALSSGTVGAATISLGTVFIPATNSFKALLAAAQLSWAGGAGAGDPIKVKLARITAEGAGGTVNTVAAIDSRDSDPAGSAISARFGAAAPTGRVVLATRMISHATPSEIDLVELYRTVAGKLPTMNQGVAEGVEVFIVTGTAGPATAAQFALTFKMFPLRTA